ncbi:hypothetical protein LTR36_004323 [Oleoguttula mirabilis]|uniref:PNPLA domain-containing protein n=1 Tax=Oleoguttula mirabilis TaxID=1507867 RepID=A0AAV9JH70_9PEZI|nr:hypothetical protein LTR36_004323 [Oleoguttula mirabilis]
MTGDTKTTPEITPPGPPLPTLRKDGARLLALDGGGVKGVSSILILDAIMEKVRELEGGGVARKPADYFDLAAGTSTGGLIALMLFRLHMSTKQCLQVYKDLASAIFAPRFLGSRFLGSLLGKVGLLINAWRTGAEFAKGPLEKAIQKVVDEYSVKGDPYKDYLVHPESKMMFMCATLAEKGESILLRSYTQPEDAKPISHLPREKSEEGCVNSIKIVQAARATSAAPIYLPAETWNGVEFWDGGVLNNNPIEQLWNARYDLVGQHAAPPKVACMLSLGCGWSKSKPTLLNRAKNVISRYFESFMANTEAKHRDFKRLVQRMEGRNDQNGEVKYFRLNVATGDKSFDMADYTIMDQLEAITRVYIGEEEIRQQIDACATELTRK